MLSKEENELLTRVHPGTAMGRLFRRYWIPALLAEEIPDADGPPVRVRLLGEDLVAFATLKGGSVCWTSIARTAALRCFSAATKSAA